MIFPQFDNMDVIDRIRAKYDPVAHLVRPHVTLVFPFMSDLGADEIRKHVQNSLAGVQPFLLSLQGIIAQKGFGNYLLLDVHRGRNKLKEMHRRLYTGILAPYLPSWCNPDCRPYSPHMTVGRVEDDEAFAVAVEAVSAVNDLFQTTVREIAVEIIEPDGSSTIESVLSL